MGLSPGRPCERCKARNKARAAKKNASDVQRKASQKWTRRRRKRIECWW
jgi:hypothetical protein